MPRLRGYQPAGHASLCSSLRSLIGLLLLWAFGCSSPCLAIEDLIEFGPKRPIFDSVVLESDIPPDLSCLTRRIKPQPDYKMLPNCDSDDPRLLKVGPNLTVHHYDKKQILQIYMWSPFENYDLFASLPRLTDAELGMEETDRLPQAALDALGTDPALQRLSLCGGDLSQLDLSALSRDSKLEALSLCRHNLSLENIRQLSTIKSLRCLELQDTKLTAEHISELSKLNQITDLRLNCRFAADADISLLKRLPNLQRLQLSDLRPDRIRQISELTNLRVLSTGASDSDIRLLSKLRNLVYLEIRSRITGETLASMRCPQLKYLSLDGCSSLTPAGFHSLGELTQLQGLDITWTKPTTEELMSLANLQKLRRLRATCIENYAGLEPLSKKIPLCTIQAQTNCPTY